MGTFYAHTSYNNFDKNDKKYWEPLKEHLELVARRASQYAAAFNAQDEAYIAGLLHDLGKYTDLFERRLEGKEKGLDHWSIGSCAVLGEYKLEGLGAAIAIQGHHEGLQSGNAKELSQKLTQRLTGATGQQLRSTAGMDEYKLLIQRLIDDNLVLPKKNNQQSCYNAQSGMDIGRMLDLRMLYSALVDADYIETEAHFNRTRDGERSYREEGVALNAEAAREILDRHIRALSENFDGPDIVKRMRNDLLENCRKAAGGPTGIFNLTAPTGSGKTLAMLDFALTHAIANRSINRVVMVIPYLSIIEQTAGIYRGIFEERFGKNYILEHHSLAGIKKDRDDTENDEQKDVTRLLSENWDAPIILTTSVQCLESLFADRSSTCRKLHRMANSIILFDEVQTLPASLATPTLAALSHLAAEFGSSVVFSTATQPAFYHLDKQVKEYANSGWKPRKIVSDENELFKRIERVKVEWEIEKSVSWEKMAERLIGENQVLCIVNLKRHAMELIDAVTKRGLKPTEEIFHLSTNMCPAHRKTMLDKIKIKLLDKKNPRCVLVATQCVEAGVDIDFPVVYRAFGPLEAIAQAAGRCNRNGRMKGKGLVHVFRPEESSYPTPDYEQAARTVEILLKESAQDGTELDINNPDLFKRYYQLYYDLTNKTKIKRELEQALNNRDFVDVAKQYQLIKGSTLNILVPYDKDSFRKLKKQLDEDGKISRNWIQQARQYTVNVYKNNKTSNWTSFLKPVPIGKDRFAEDWAIWPNEDNYDELRGLVVPEDFINLLIA